MVLEAFRRVGHLLPVYVLGARAYDGLGSARPAHHTSALPICGGDRSDMVLLGVESPVAINQSPVVVGQSGLGRLQQYDLLAGGFFASLFRGGTGQPFGHPQRSTDHPVPPSAVAAAGIRAESAGPS